MYNTILFIRMRPFLTSYMNILAHTKMKFELYQIVAKTNDNFSLAKYQIKFEFKYGYLALVSDVNQNTNYMARMLSCHESGGEKIVIKFQYILLNTSSFLQNTFTHRPYSIEISAPATESTENSPVFHTKMLSTRIDSHRTQTAFWALKSIYKIPAPYFVSFILNMPLIQYGPMY